MRCSFIIARDLRSAGTIKKERGNPNDSARFIGKVAVTEDGETAKIYNYLDTEKIEQEALYDGMYAVTTDLLDDDVKDILKVSEGRWEIEECFRIMKTDFKTRPGFYSTLHTRQCIPVTNQTMPIRTPMIVRLQRFCTLATINK